MKRALVTMIALGVFGLIAGCVTRQPTAQRLTLINVPDKNHAFEGPQKMHPCYIVKTGLDSSDTMMTVHVDGEVSKQGAYQVRQGTTVLEAIAKAGGFTDHAAPRRIHVKVGETEYVFPVHHKKSEFRTLDRAWCGDGEDDFVLQPGGSVYVPRR